jgi:hypothetical protein
MKRFVEGIDRKQSTPFPECLEDWIDKDNLVHEIDVFVERLDLADLGFVGAFERSAFMTVVHQAMHKALEVKHRGRHHTDDEPERRRRRRSGRVRKIHNASGFPDAVVDGRRAARLFDYRSSNVEASSTSLIGYEQAGEPIGEDEDVD